MQVVGVLILVNEDVAEFFLVVGPHVLELLEQPDRVQNDIVKVQGACVPEPPLVLDIHIGDFLQPQVPGLPAPLLIVLGQQQFVLGP